MKISQKLIRRTFLLLSPLLLGISIKGCNVLGLFIFTLFCLADPFLPQGPFGLGQGPQHETIYIANNGEIFKPVLGFQCQFTLDFTVPGGPDLYDITYQWVNDAGNIIVGANGTIFRFDPPLQSNFIPNPAGTQDLNAIDQDLPSPNVVAVGDSGTVIKSTDNGLSWSVVSFPSLANLNSCTIIGDYILVGGDGYSAYQSEDFGETWEQVGLGENFNSVDPTSFNAIFFVDNNVGYMGGPWGLMGKTTDGGANWVTFGVPDFEEIYDLFFISPDSGVVVGKPSMVRFTADGGTTWEEDPGITSLLAGSSIKKIGALSEEFGIAITDSGSIISFATDSSLLTAVNEDGIHIHNYSLSNNYPNPFNPSTIIEYSLPQFGFVTLTVYDMLGREIAILVNEEKPAGNYKFEFNAGDLASGVYYYQINIGNEFIETKKMVLLR
jgi:photosystem II stability/assembly factor-like uncharacterized protein